MNVTVPIRESRYYRRRKTIRLVLLGLPGAGLAAGLGWWVAKDALLAITIVTVTLLVAMVIRWPIFGYFMAVFVVLPCEIFLTDDFITPYSILPLTNLNIYTPLPVSATPLEITIALTLVVAAVKASLKGERFLEWNITTGAMLLLGAFLAYAYVWGVYIKRGDPKTAQWEVRALVYIIVLYFLTAYFMRDRKYWKVLNWIIPIGLTLQCAVAIERLFVVKDKPGETFYAESINGYNHDTAILFVILIIWCLTKLIYGDSRLEKFVAWVLVGPAFFCMLISGRRAAFAVLAGCAIIFLATLVIRHRKAFIISVIILALVVPPYMVVFRNASGPLGAAARAFSSTSAEPGSRDYNSDLYRLVEKTNVQLTIKTAPFTGVGFGQPFYRFINFLDLDGFVFQYYTPHVQVLWVWLKLGMFGWGLFWFLICTSLFKMGQVIKYDKLGSQMTMTLVCGIILVSIMIFSYLDLGLINTRLMTLFGVAIGVIELAYRSLERPVKRKHDKLPDKPRPGKTLVASK